MGDDEEIIEENIETNNDQEVVIYDEIYDEGELVNEEITDENDIENQEIDEENETVRVIDNNQGDNKIEKNATNVSKSINNSNIPYTGKEGIIMIIIFVMIINTVFLYYKIKKWKNV